MPFPKSKFKNWVGKFMIFFLDTPPCQKFMILAWPPAPLLGNVPKFYLVIIYDGFPYPFFIFKSVHVGFDMWIWKVWNHNQFVYMLYRVHRKNATGCLLYCSSINHPQDRILLKTDIHWIQKHFCATSESRDIDFQSFNTKTDNVTSGVRQSNKNLFDTRYMTYEILPCSGF